MVVGSALQFANGVIMICRMEVTVKPQVHEAYKLFEELRDIQEDIDQLEERKNRVEGQLERLIIGQQSNIVTLNQSHIGETVRRGRTASETSAKKVITRWINSHPEANFSAEIVAEHTQIHLGTVRTNLSKLVRDGVLEKRSANTYGAIRQEKEAPKEEAS
jgi:TolA-binding protein